MTSHQSHHHLVLLACLCAVLVPKDVSSLAVKETAADPPLLPPPAPMPDSKPYNSTNTTTPAVPEPDPAFDEVPKYPFEVFAQFSDGTPIPDFTVNFPQFGYDYYNRWTFNGTAGKAEFQLPAGNYSLIDIKFTSGGSVGPTGGQLFRRSAPFFVPGTSQLNYTIKTFTFKGRLVADDGKPLPAGNLSARYCFNSSSCDSYGWFRVPTKGPLNEFNVRVVPGTITSIYLPAYGNYLTTRFGEYTVRGDNTSAVFAYERGAVIWGFAGFTNGSALADWWNLYYSDLYAVSSWTGNAHLSEYFSVPTDPGVYVPVEQNRTLHTYRFLLPKNNNYTFYLNDYKYSDALNGDLLPPVKPKTLVTRDMKLNLTLPFVTVTFNVSDKETGSDLLERYGSVKFCVPLPNRPCSCTSFEGWSTLSVDWRWPHARILPPGSYVFRFGNPGNRDWYYSPRKVVCSKVLRLDGAKRRAHVALQSETLHYIIPIYGSLNGKNASGGRAPITSSRDIYTSFRVTTTRVKDGRLISNIVFGYYEDQYYGKTDEFRVAVPVLNDTYRMTISELTRWEGFEASQYPPMTTLVSVNTTSWDYPKAIFDIRAFQWNFTLVPPGGSAAKPLNVTGSITGYTDIKASGGLNATFKAAITNGRGSVFVLPGTYTGLVANIDILDAYGYVRTQNSMILPASKVQITGARKQVVVIDTLTKRATIRARFVQPSNTSVRIVQYTEGWPELYVEPSQRPSLFRNDFRRWNGSQTDTFIVNVATGLKHRIGVSGYFCGLGEYEHEYFEDVITDNFVVWNNNSRVQDIMLPTATWSGTVVDNLGKPIKGARLSATPDKAWINCMRTVSATTDDKGRFSIPFLKKQRYSNILITSIKDQWAAGSSAAGFPDLKLTANFNGRYTLVSGPIRVTGKLRFKNGPFITEGQLIASCGGYGTETKLDAKTGSYKLLLPYNAPCNVSAYLSSGGFVGARIPVLTNVRFQKSAVKLLEIEASVLKGRIVDKLKKPVAGARLIANRWHDYEYAEYGSIIEQDQVFAIANRNGNFEITVAKNNYTGASIWPAEGGFGAITAFGNLTLTDNVVEQTFVMS